MGFMQGTYRRVLAESIEEAQSVFAAAGYAPRAPKRQEQILLRFFVHILRSPQWLFMLTVGRKLRGRGEGRTSMAQDLMAHRVPTEIEYLNGEVVRLGEAHGVPTPVNSKLIELVHAAEQANVGCPGHTGDALLKAVGMPAQSS